VRGARTPAALLALVVASAAAGAEPPPQLVVTARGLASIVIGGAGASALRSGERLSVRRGDEVIAVLEVAAAGPTTASCRIVSQRLPIGAGDRVARVTAPAAPVATTAPTPPIAPTPRPAATAVVAVPPPAPPPAAPPALQPPSGAAPGAVARAPLAALDPSLSVGAAPTTPAVPAATSAASAPTPVARKASAPAPAPAQATAASPAPPSPMAPGPVPVAAATPAPPRAGARFAVKYRSASNVYLDGGRAQGLGTTDRLRIFAGETMVSELEVVYAAEQSASCRVVSEIRPVQIGDVAVRMTPEAGVKALVAAAATAPRSSPATPATPAASTSGAFATGGARIAGPWARVRGSASIGLYRTWDQTESNYDFQERTGRLDLGLYDIAGQPLSFTLRGRSRQDIRARTLAERTPQSERVDRLYEVALRYERPADNLGIEAGRIGIYRFVGIGYLDGVLARFRPVRDLQLGGFAGRNADVETLGYGGTGAKYGGFVRLAPGGRWATGAYDATLAFVREDADGDVSREYLSLESRFGSGRRWSLFERAELDLNRGWRQEITGRSYQLSNVSVSGNLRVASTAWAYLSYDGRRNYRYYLNRVVPEEVFDDLLHQGLRAGINLNRPGGFGATAGFGMTLKEPDPRNPELEIANAYSFNGGVRHAALFGTPLSAGVDFSGYSNGYTDGGLLLARLGRRFAGGHMVDLSYGRSAYRLKSTSEDRSTQFFRLMGRAELVRRIYLQGDFEYDSGDDLKGPRGFLELGILF
jgi:hypothetical protein